ncbi:MAG: O-antigen ligase family protein, partial [Candidatus Dormibacteraceae bacterium]
FSVAFVVYGAGARERWIALACSALIFVAMLLTLSRASYLAMAVLAVLLVVTLPNPRWRIAAVAALALIALVVAELPIFSERLATFAHSAQLRTSIYEQALKMLAQRPLTGAGISGFPIRVAPFRPASQEIELYPHNLWLTTWSELGLLGLASFAVIFFGLLGRGWRTLARVQGTYLAATWGVVGTLVLYLVHGMFDSPYWKNDLSVEFWIVAAFAMICARAARDQSLRAGGAVQSRSSSA